MSEKGDIFLLDKFLIIQLDKRIIISWIIILYFEKWTTQRNIYFFSIRFDLIIRYSYS